MIQDNMAQPGTTEEGRGKEQKRKDCEKREKNEDTSLINLLTMRTMPEENFIA
jgi:hypothetical protein